MAHRSRAAHVGCSLSCVELLTVVYFRHLRLEPWEERDVFVLSKAHAAPCLYAVLAERGVIDPALLDGYGLDGGTLPAHLDRTTCRGVEVSAGALGHGFSVALGLAHAFKLQGSDRRVYVLIGDGEAQEGAIWEGALFAPRLGLDNVVALMDDNDLQGYGRPREITAFEPMRQKWEAFGWSCAEVDGHDADQLDRTLSEPSRGRPRMLLARTVKGKGVSFMEDRLEWHYYVVTDELLERALRELE
jgi:transketolase